MPETSAAATSAFEAAMREASVLIAELRPRKMMLATDEWEQKVFDTMKESFERHGNLFESGFWVPRGKAR